jgi:hypothetical protein
MVFKTFGSEKQRAIWTYIAALLGVAVRLTAMFADRLDVDVYYLMADTDRSFFEYTGDGGFSRTLMAYWWIITRSLGEGIFSHRIIPFLLNVVAIILVAAWAYRFQKDSPYAAVFATCFFGFSSWATYTVEYPVINYSAEVLLGVLLFGFVYKTFSSDTALTRHEISLLLLCFLILGPFTSYTTIIPVCACIVTSIIWNNRFLLSKPAPWLSLGNTLRLWPIAVLPLIQLMLWLTIPYRHLGKKLPTHMFQYFFDRSGYASNILGALQFSFQGTRLWTKGLIAPIGSDELFDIISTSQKLVYGVAILTVICTVGFLAVTKRMGKPIAIASIYIVIVASAILFGGLISVFPYGTVRYTGWLLMPVAIVFGSVVGAWAGFIEDRLSSERGKMIVPAIGFAVCLMLLLLHTEATVSRRLDNYATVDLVRNPAGYREVLFSGFIAPALRVLAPEATHKGIDLGFGKVHKSVEEKILDPKALAVFRLESKSDEPSSVAVCAQSRERFAELHPSWYEVMTSRYSLSEERQSPDLWVGVYRK